MVPLIGDIKGDARTLDYSSHGCLKVGRFKELQRDHGDSKPGYSGRVILSISRMDLVKNYKRSPAGSSRAATKLKQLQLQPQQGEDLPTRLAWPEAVAQVAKNL